MLRLFVLVLLLSSQVFSASQKIIDVAKGETLYKLAARCGCDVAALKKQNNLSSDVVAIHQKIVCPEKLAPKNETVAPKKILASKIAAGKAAPKNSVLKNPDSKTPNLKTPTVNKSVTAKTVVKKVLVKKVLVKKVSTKKMITKKSITKKITAKKRLLNQLPYSVRMGTKTMRGVPLAIMRVNLKHPRVSVRPLMPRRGLGRGGGERLTRMAAREGAYAAINGGYFDTRSYAPVGDVVYKGRRLASGRIRTALALDYNGQAKVITGRQHFRNYKLLIANGPHVLQSNQIVISPRFEGYKDSAVWLPNARSFVGVVGTHELVFVCAKTKITLRQAARIAQALGAHDALMLDGGSSTGFVWRGKTLVRPIRSVAYGLGVFLN